MSNILSDKIRHKNIVPFPQQKNKESSMQHRVYKTDRQPQQQANRYNNRKNNEGHFKISRLL